MLLLLRGAMVQVNVDGACECRRGLAGASSVNKEEAAALLPVEATVASLQNFWA